MRGEECSELVWNNKLARKQFSGWLMKEKGKERIDIIIKRGGGNSLACCELQDKCSRRPIS